MYCQFVSNVRCPSGEFVGVYLYVAVEVACCHSRSDDCQGIFMIVTLINIALLILKESFVDVTYPTLTQGISKAVVIESA